MSKPTITSVQEYRGKYIPEYSDGSATVSMMKYADVEAARKAIDRLILLTKNVIG